MLGEMTPLEQTRAYREIVAKNQPPEPTVQPHWTLNLKNGLKVNVPADLDNPVTLTLLEYEDWPEPEFAFLRQLAQPGLRALDADTGLRTQPRASAARAGQGARANKATAPSPIRVVF